MPLLLFQEVASAVLRGRELIARAAWPVMVSYVGRLLLIGALLVVSGVLRCPVSSSGELGAWALWAILVWTVLALALPRWPMASGTVAPARLFSYGLQNQATELLHMLFHRADLFLINHLIGEAAVGIYSISMRVANLALFAPDRRGHSALCPPHAP